MSRPEFKSGFADEINKYIDFKVANGYKEKSYTILLHEFDRFCVRRGITDVSFTKEDADAWSEKRETEVQIASLNGHLCHIWRPACDLNGGQPRTH